VVTTLETNMIIGERLQTTFANLDRVAVGSNNHRIVTLVTDPGQADETDCEPQMLARTHGEAQNSPPPIVTLTLQRMRY
jgi:hypothetical protein